MGESGPKTPEKVSTIRDIKNQFIARFGEADKWTDAQKIVWQELNRLGARNMHKIPPETVPDIDATVELLDEEVHDLEEKMNRL